MKEKTSYTDADVKNITKRTDSFYEAFNVFQLLMRREAVRIFEAFAGTMQL